MKNGCINEHLESKLAERSERAKKVYRYVSDVARRLSEATAECRVIADLFSTNIECLRQKLRDHCEKLFFLDPINYGKKSLELLWRKVYYDTVSAAKKLRESDNGCDNNLFTHIVCGIGHFHHLMIRVQSEMNIELKNLDFLPLYFEDEQEENLQDKIIQEDYQLGKSVLYSCLIYLGDLSRYQVEIFNTFESSLAARYYLQAAQIDLTSGMPFNQLGNLYLDKNYNLDSVCYYIHCLNTLTPFEGAMGNLIKIFEKNVQFCDAITNTESLTQTEHMQMTMANFLSLIEIWYLGKDDINIPKICNTIALQLKIAMDFNKMPLPDINKNYTEYTQAVEEENVNPSYLNPSIIHNIVRICLFTIAKLNETDESKAFACKAFTLAFLSQVLQKLLKQVESFGLKNPAHKYNERFASKFKRQMDNIEVTTQTCEESNEPAIDDIKLTNGDKNDHEENFDKEVTSEKEITTLHNGDAKNTKKTTTKRRRRRRVASSESSDMSDIETESSGVDSDKSDSEEEELSDSTFQSDDDSKSEGSVYDYSDNDETNIQINGGAEENIDESKNTNKISASNEVNNSLQELVTENEKDKLVISDVENFFLGDNILPSLKLLQDWVLTEKDLILSCGDSGEALFQCIVDLLNIFLFYFNPKNNEVKNLGCRILIHAKKLAKKLKLEYKSIPLPEDINLRGTDICKFDKDATEWQMMEKFKPTIIEENVIRILNFIDFGYHTAKIIPRIRYNRSLKIFYFKKVLPPKVNTKMNHKKNREWHNSKKQAESGESGLLRRLGRLWLASQVRELERTKQTDVPSLLAIDTATLYKHLRRVKQLLRTRNFIFLVPTVVFQELDELKREKSSARDAIRWLEVQLKSGSRFLRTQRPGQSRPLPLLKYPRKAPPHVHNFIQILEFCNHFMDEKQNQGGNGDPDASYTKSAPLLILLVGNELGKSDDEYKEFSVTGAAQASGIPIKYIGDFYTKWRQTVHKSKKR
ncbi:unnamed protein product, partial [Brenthis ino]